MGMINRVTSVDKLEILKVLTAVWLIGRETVNFIWQGIDIPVGRLLDNVIVVVGVHKVETVKLIPQGGVI